MAKKKNKNSQKSPQVEEKKQDLSEWQKRNKAYLEKKAQEEADKKEELELKKEEHLKVFEDKTDDGTEEDEKETEEQEKTEVDADDENDDNSTEKSSEELELDEETEEQSQESLNPKEQKKVAKQAIKEEKKRGRKIATRHIVRSVPIFLLAGILALVGGYFMTPLASIKHVIVSGNNRVSTDTILSHSGIDQRDYTLTTWVNRANHSRNIQAADPWLKSVSISYSFPTTFHIKVKEYDIVSYTQEGDQFHPVLASGVQSQDIVTADKMPQKYLLISINNADLLKQFVQQMKDVSTSIKDSIATVALAPSKATPDLLNLTMTDGNRVLVPLSEIKKKLPYYSVIKEKLEVASIVDMEVGAYSYPIEQEQKQNSEQNTDQESGQNTEQGTEQAPAENEQRSNETQ
ncbi:cell division protein FtsQ/DivIB [Streptococcus massiliensis]|uniref:Cell division protein DivIB n=1 Tax=Streptococcus massiliensis TaxID=313439 RepID=A0A380L1Z7_9STRE|nr:FtsQ-type POTRA domain-containing protein [Streptococcus massiliensis]SUN77488.1 cell division protein DivIB [Streptococcus massiliensis]